jgi:dihydrofolate synthase/folylpolyglutamate synthase
MRFQDAVAALDARTNYERTGRLVAPTIERITALLEMLDHPEQGYPVIHVTGTNGKSTIARAASEVLAATGLQVATYSSPHVSSIRERFQYGGEPVGEDDFVEAWRELSPYLDYFDERGMQITWFEAATALAFVIFADKAVDAAVIEVGMGGTWDATNVVYGEVSVIGEVALDHAVLGATPVEIAREKTGIVKQESIVVSAAQSPEVLEVVRAACAGRSADLRLEGEAFELEKAALAIAGQALTFRLDRDRYPDVFLPTFGEHFARDAVVGAAAARALIGDVALADDVIAAAFTRIKLPGRMEIAHRAPLVVLDGAHNPAAARALAAAMPASFQWGRLWLVASVMDDKDVRGVLEPLVALADEVIVTCNASPRATSPDALASEVRALGKEPTIVAEVADAISVAIERAEDTDCILVAGSLYTVGEARDKLVGAR